LVRKVANKDLNALAAKRKYSKKNPLCLYGLRASIVHISTYLRG